MNKLMSFREIGERLGISEDAAKRDYYRAMKKIKKFMKNNKDIAEDIKEMLK